MPAGKHQIMLAKGFTRSCNLEYYSSPCLKGIFRLMSAKFARRGPCWPSHQLMMAKMTYKSMSAGES